MGLFNLKRFFILFFCSLSIILTASRLSAQNASCTAQPSFIDVAGVYDPNFPSTTQVSTISASSILGAVVAGGYYEGTPNVIGSSYLFPTSIGIHPDSFITMFDLNMNGILTMWTSDAANSTTLYQETTDTTFYDDLVNPAFAFCITYGDTNSPNTIDHNDTNPFQASIGGNHVVSLIGGATDSVTVGTTQYGGSGIYTNTAKSQDANSYVKAVEVAYDAFGYPYGTGNVKGNVQLVCNPICNSPVLTTNNNSQDFYVVAFNQGQNRSEHWPAILFGGPGYDEVTSIVANPMDNSILLGGSLDFSQGSIINPVSGIAMSFSGRKGFLAKIDRFTGAFLNFSVLDSGVGDSQINDIAIDKTTAAVFLAGYTDASTDFDFGLGVTTNIQAGPRDAFLAKYGVAGDFKWRTALGIPSYPAILNKIAINSQGDVIGAGTAYDATYSDGESILLKFEGDDLSFGSLITTQTFIGLPNLFDKITDLSLYDNDKKMIVSIGSNGTNVFPGVLARFLDPCNP